MKSYSISLLDWLVLLTTKYLNSCCSVCQNVFFFFFGRAVPSYILGFPGGSDGEESACNVGDPGSIPRLGRSPGEGTINPLQYSCLENPMDRGTLWILGSQRVRHD